MRSDAPLDGFLECSGPRRLRLLIQKPPHCGLDVAEPCALCETAEKMLDAALRNEYDRGRRDAAQDTEKGAGK